MVMNTTKQNALFTELYNAYCQPLYGYLYRLVGDVARAEELVQDVFMRAYAAPLDPATQPNYRAWLYRIATNAARDWFRRQRLRRWLPLGGDDDDPNQPEGLPADDTSLPVEERLAVEDALRSLPPNYRAPLVLFVIEGLAVAEIATVIGISPGAVKTRLCRARALFRDAYGANQDAPKTVAQESGNLS
jgi:RNA polymerase sigma-70 factor (ECF subfamily)